MRVRSVVAVAMFASLLAAGPTFAQRQGPFGGFGGGGGGGIVGLVSRDDVQQEIKLMPEQKEEITKILEKAREQRQGFNFQEFRNLSEEDREKRMTELRARGEETQKAVEKELLPDQVARVKQIALQQQGVFALRSDEVAKELGLSDDQKTQIQEKLTSTFRRGNRGEQGADRGNFQERRAQLEKDILGVLTDAQKEKFEKMKGSKFEFSDSGRRPRGDDQPRRRRPGGERPNPDT